MSSFDDRTGGEGRLWAADHLPPIGDDELTALALAADPSEDPDPDAVPLILYPDLPSGALPLSYMPPAMTRAGGWRVPVVMGVVIALLLIDAVGLCITYGSLVAA